MNETTVEAIRKYIVYEATDVLTRTFNALSIPAKEGRDMTDEEGVEMAKLAGEAEAIARIAEHFGWIPS